jgi:neutral ceramidase
VLLSIEPGSLTPLAARSTVLSLKRRLPDQERVKHCLEVVNRDPKEANATEWTFAKEIVLLDAMVQKEPVVEVEVQAIQIGPAIFLANPGETFCQYGLDLKARSPFPFTFPVELANGCVGYIPTEDALGEHGGGYETRLTSCSNLEPTAGRLMTDAAFKLATQLQPGPIPKPAPAPPFREPWSYGNVPPERK